jgi:CHASE3 domain sensor protein
MKRFFSDNWIILVIGLAFVASAAAAIRNNSIIEQNHLIVAQTSQVRQSSQSILNKIVHGLDLGVRGFGLTHDEKLLTPYHEAVEITPGVFKKLDSLLEIQQYPERQNAYAVMVEIRQYIEFSNQMVDHARNGDMKTFVDLLKEDRGYEVWSKYAAFTTPLIQFEDALGKESMEAYNFAVKSNLYLQIVILLLCLPVLFLFVTKVNRERKKRQAILRQVENADRTFVFNDGVTTESISEEINVRSVQHVRQASDFIASLATGNYDTHWAGMTGSNQALNEKTLAGNLFRLRDRLKTVKLDDDRRNSVNEGLAQFSELVRTYHDDAEKLSMRSISFLTKYLNAQQGSIFVLEGDDNDQHLKLMGCFAFDRKKFIEKRVEIGSGMVGQAFLEGEPVLMKEIPKGYTKITSGLGDATPSCIAIIPLKQDRVTVAVMEFATFEEVLPHQVAFLQKAGEYFASTIITTRTTLKMKKLLEDATVREAMMREREEELKQNMEELQATQEQLTRNERSLSIA